MNGLKGILFDSLPYDSLEVVGVLLFDIYPATVVFKDGTNQPIIREWADCNKDGTINRYFYYQTDRSSLKKYINRIIPHIDLINSSVENYVYFQDVKNEGIGNATLVSISSIPSNYLPQSDFYFDKNDGVDTDKIIEIFGLNDIQEPAAVIPFRVKQISKQQNSETLYIHFDNGNGVGHGTIRTRILASALSCVESLYKNMAIDYSEGIDRGDIRQNSQRALELLELTDTEIYGEQIRASYGFMIRPVNTFINNFNPDKSPSSLIADKFLNLITKSQNEEQVKQEYQSHSKFTMASYEIFLKEIYENELKMDINWYNPKSQNEITSTIDYISANKVQENIKALSFSDKKDISILGKFRAVNIETAHFIFLSTKEGRFSGKFDKTTKEGLDQVNFVDVYKLVISRSIEKRPGKEDKYSDEIVSFVKQ